MASVPRQKAKGKRPGHAPDLNKMSDNLKSKTATTKGSGDMNPMSDNLKTKGKSKDKHVGFGKGRRYK